MKSVLYHSAYALIWLITLLPLRILFLISDFMFVLLYYLIRYRRKVVMKNLVNSFPEKSQQEISTIARKFYRHLTDTFVELVYPLNMRKSEHSRRYKFKNTSLLDDLYKQDRNILLMMSHYGNWEWLSILPEFTDFTSLAIYKPLQNKKFDKLIHDLRGKYGVIGVPMESTLRSLIRYEQKREPVIMFSLADQRPQWKTTRYWARFMNQDSAILAGAEKVSRRFNMAVIYLKVSKVKRGCYEIEFVPVCIETDRAVKFEITRNYLDIVETVIKERPEYWLWSHNRWKYKRDIERNHVDIDQVH
jgi:Kdo2-lipid IVA lauroyltransferase/acyltransferase